MTEALLISSISYARTAIISNFESRRTVSRSGSRIAREFSIALSLLTPEFSKAYPVLRRMAHMLLNGALVVCLNQVASVLALGLKLHVEPLIFLLR